MYIEEKVEYQAYQKYLEDIEQQREQYEREIYMQALNHAHNCINSIINGLTLIGKHNELQRRI